MKKARVSSGKIGSRSGPTESWRKNEAIDPENAERKIIPKNQDCRKANMRKDASVPACEETNSRSKDVDDTHNGNRIQTSPVAWNQISKKKKLAKQDVNVVIKTPSNSSKYESKQKAKSLTLNASNMDVNKDSLQKQKNGKRTSVGRVQGEGLENRQMLKYADEDRFHRIVDEDRTIASKSPVYSWSYEDETLLASCFLRDFKSHGCFPPNQIESYWTGLAEELKGSIDVNFSRSQIYEKHRRMKCRYNVLTTRMLSGKSKQPIYKNDDEEKLYCILQQIWGDDGVQRQDSLDQKPVVTDRGEKNDKGISGEKPSEERIVASNLINIKPRPSTKLVSVRKFKSSKLGPRASGDNRHNVAKESLQPVVYTSPYLSNEDTSCIHREAPKFQLIHEINTSFATALKEENIKFHTFMENSLKQCDEKFKSLFKIVTPFEYLSGAGATLSCVYGDISDLKVPFYTSRPEDSSTGHLLQQMLNQQSLEIEVHERKMKLLQQVLDHRLRMLKRK